MHDVPCVPDLAQAELGQAATSVAYHFAFVPLSSNICPVLIHLKAEGRLMHSQGGLGTLSALKRAAQQHVKEHPLTELLRSESSREGLSHAPAKSDQTRLKSPAFVVAVDDSIVVDSRQLLLLGQCPLQALPLFLRPLPSRKSCNPLLLLQSLP